MASQVQRSFLTPLVNKLESLVDKNAVGFKEQRNGDLIETVDYQTNGVYYYDGSTRKLTKVAADSFRKLEFLNVSMEARKQLVDLAQSATTDIEKAIQKLEKEIPKLNSEIAKIRGTSKEDLAAIRTKSDNVQYKIDELVKLRNHLPIAKAALENKSLKIGFAPAKPLTACQKVTKFAVNLLAAVGVAAIGYAIRAAYYSRFA